MAKNCKINYESSVIEDYLYVPIKDKRNVNIRQHFEQCYNFIEDSRKRTNVLIHCKAGVSRSVSVLVAYIMKKFNYSLLDAYSLVKQANPQVI